MLAFFQIHLCLQLWITKISAIYNTWDFDPYRDRKALNWFWWNLAWSSIRDPPHVTITLVG